MEENEIIEADDVDVNQVPTIIESQFLELEKLEKSVHTAIAKAEEAQDSAERARSMSAGWFKKKEAIETLQWATSDLAEAQISSVEAQKVSFGYQEKLGQITKYLFNLGVSNITMNRMVVREIEMRLRGASKEELSDLARQEMLNVVRQLKAQEDMMKKQADLTKRVKQHDETLRSHHEKEKEFEKQLTVLERKNVEQDQQLTSHANHNQKQDRIIETHSHRLDDYGKHLNEQNKRLKQLQKAVNEQKKKVGEQEEQLAQHKKTLDLHQKLLTEREETGRAHQKELNDLRNEDEQNKHQLASHSDEIIQIKQTLEDHQTMDNEQAALIEQQGKEINRLQGEIKALQTILETKSSKTITYVTLGIAVVSIVLGIWL